MSSSINVASSTSVSSSAQQTGIQKKGWFVFGIITAILPIMIIISSFVDSPGLVLGIVYWLFAGAMAAVPVQLIGYGRSGKWEDTTGWFIAGIIAYAVFLFAWLS